MTKFSLNYGKNLSVCTIKIRLTDAGLHRRRPSKNPLISKKNRAARLKFAKEHLNWTSEQWSKILWSDESKFNMLSSDGIRYVRRPTNKIDDVKYHVPTVTHGGGSVMVWGCFSRDVIGPLRRINGAMNRFVYEKILDTHMLLHAMQVVGHDWVFQQDNDPRHT